MKTNYANGFGVIQVIIAMILMGILGVSFTKLISSSLKQQKTTEQRNNILELNQQIRQLMFDEAACRNTFAAITKSMLTGGTNPTITSIKDNVGGTYAENYSLSGKKYGGNSFIIHSLSLTDIRDQGVHDGRFKVIATLSMNFQKANDAGLHDFIPREFDIVFVFKRFDASTSGPDSSVESGNLHTCFALGNKNTELWIKKSTGEIYYNGGNIGINQNDPQTTLDVGGNIKAAGSIQVGPQNLICDTAAQGTLRFNALQKVMQFCDGTTWKTQTLKVLAPAPTSQCSCGSGGSTGCSSCALFNGDYWAETTVACPSDHYIISASAYSSGSDETSNYHIDTSNNQVKCRGQGFKYSGLISFTCTAVCALK